MEILNIVLDFILIFAIFISLSYPEEFSLIVNTIYGKLIALLVIILYSYINTIYGLFICLIIIYYYQCVYIDELTKYYNKLVESFEELKPDNIEIKIPKKNEITYYDNSESSIYNLLEYENNNNNKILDTIVNTTNNIDNSKNSNNETATQKFIEETCINNHPYYKSFLVRTDMIRYIFPEVKFHKKECNICDKTCGFSIDDKLVVQEELQTPKNSNDYIESTLFERMKTTAFNSLNYIDILTNNIFEFI